MITLGSTVKDTITGFSGVAVERATFMFGCSRLGVQPTKLNPDGSPQAVELFDDQRLKTTKKGPPRKAPKFKFEFGDQVKDRVSGFTGVVTARVELLSGDIHYDVTPIDLGEKGELKSSYSLSESRLDLVKKEVVTTVPEKESISRTGGPQTRAKSPTVKRA